MADVANLKIKPKKCKIVPLGNPSLACFARVKEWICVNIPEWRSCEIVDTAEYLGFWLGPGSEKMQWVGVRGKMNSRFSTIKNASSSTTLSLHI